MKKHYLLSLLIACFLANFTTQVNAQTTLAQGDISIIGFNANSPDGFVFVNWVDIAANTVIKFTDNGFNSASGSNTAGNYREQEQYVVWTNNTGGTIVAGTVITLEANSPTAPTATVTNIGTITSVTNSSTGGATSNISLTNTSGDQVFAFQGAGGPSTGLVAGTFSGTLLFGLDYSGSTGISTSWITTGAINGSTSYLPGDLSGSSQIFLGPNIVAGQYTGPKSGQASLGAYKALVANPANWSTVGTTGTVTFSTTTFTAVSPPSITGQPSNSSICAGGTTAFSITASNAITYQWQVNTGSGFVNLSNGAPYSGVTTAGLTITAATSALNGYQYQCVVTGASAPNATSNAATLTVKTLPVATATPASATICSGTATNIALTSAPTGASFAWTAATASGTVNGASASSGTSIAQILSGNGTTNYTVTPTLNSCAGSPITVAVTVNPNPTATATPASATICSGAATNIALTSTPTGASFAWTAATASGTVNGASASSGTSIAQILSGNGTTNYTVTPTLNSCAGSPITVAVTVNPNPTATATPASATICSGTATNIALTSAPTGASFAWTAATASGTVNGASASSGTSIAQILSGNGTTDYTVTPTLNGCSGSPITVTITVSTPGTWLGTSSTAWGDMLNWGCSTLPTSSTNVTIPGGTTFSPLIDITTAACNNLTVNSGAAIAFSGTTNVLSVSGNIIIDGTFDATQGKVLLGGSSQTIAGLTYGNLEISGTDVKTLSASASVSNTLTLTSGYLQLDDNDLTLDEAAIISGGSSSAFIITNGPGKLVHRNIGVGGKTGMIVFPIGSNSLAYTPLSLANTGTSDDFSVRMLPGVNSSYDAGDAPNGSEQVTLNVDKTWIVAEATPGGSSATLTFQWNSSDEQPGFDRLSCFASHYYGDAWHQGAQGSAASGSDPYTISLSNVTTFSPFGVGSTGSALPLTLISFTGKANATANLLSWTTANEINIASFIIERSTDGSHFTAIGSVDAVANGLSGEQQYQFTDDRSAALSFYRLKLTDKDGAYRYSAIVVVNNGDNSASGYTIFPNPVNGAVLHIKPLATVTDRVTVSVADAAGRKWYTAKIDASSLNSGNASIPVNSLPAGIYLLHIVNEKTGVESLLKFKR